MITEIIVFPYIEICIVRKTKTRFYNLNMKRYQRVLDVMYFMGFKPYIPKSDNHILPVDVYKKD